MNNDELNDFLRTLTRPVDGTGEIVSGMSLKDLFDRRLQQLALSQTQVEKLLGIEHKTLVGILDRSAKRVDIVNVLKLGNFLNLAPESLIDIYLTEMPAESIKEIEQAKKSSFIMSNFDVNTLYKVKFLDKKGNIQQAEERIKRFFNLEKVFDYQDHQVFPAFSRTKKSSNNLMRDFWIKSALVHFQGIKNPNDYDRDALVDLIPKIRPYTMNVEKGLLTVIQALFHAGVTVIYQPQLPTVQVRGATFAVDGKPCIVLTDFQKNYPTIWFALMHELHHVLYDWDDIERNVYHLTGEPDLFLINEEAANDFARDYLFSHEKSNYIKPLIKNELLVREYARKAQVHPSFVYNFYSYDQNEKGNTFAWSWFKDQYPDVKLAIKELNTNPWERETIDESIAIIKETVFKLM